MVVLILTEVPPTDAWSVELIAQLKQRGSQLDVRIWPESGSLNEIEVVLAWYPPLGTLKTFPNLKLILSLGVGVDHILRDPELPREVPIARLVPERLASQMTEYAIQAVLMFKGRRLEYREFQQRQQWHPLPPPNRQEFIVGVLGLGALGARVAQGLSAIGLPVRGWSRSPKQLVGVDCFFGREQLSLCLSQCRVLVNLLPLTPATEGILSAKTFAALPQGAYIVNVGRGQHLIEVDLLEAIASGQIAGACLDVFDTEPLPQEHPFWRHPRIVITPHVAAVGEIDDVVAYILDAIARLKTGSLKHCIDRDRGY